VVVIPGRVEDANPESRCCLAIAYYLEIPGLVLAHHPGMTVA
jgi:hypothetical protein